MTIPSTEWAVIGTGSIATTTIPDLIRTKNVDVVAGISRRIRAPVDALGDNTQEFKNLLVREG
jgi:hypothetical protein